MKLLAILLSLSLVSPVLGETAPGALPPLVITAPHPTKAEIQRLKKIRTAGSVAAVSGTGLLFYGALVAGTGPIGWAAGLMFGGGLTAYLAHRRLNGHDDFGPTNAVAPSAARSDDRESAAPAP